MQAASFDIKSFQLEKIINFDHHSKVVSLLGSFASDPDAKKAVVVLYKNGFGVAPEGYDQVFKRLKTAECVHGVSRSGSC